MRSSTRTCVPLGLCAVAKYGSSISMQRRRRRISSMWCALRTLLGMQPSDEGSQQNSLEVMTACRMTRIWFTFMMRTGLGDSESSLAKVSRPWFSMSSNWMDSTMKRGKDTHDD